MRTSTSTKAVYKRGITTLSASGQNGPWALLVDDDPVSALVMLEVLSNLGLNVTVVFDGLDAVETLKQKSFDLFILDWRMPDCSGSDVIQALYKLTNQKDKERARITSMPLIVYSGVSEEYLDPPKELNFFEYVAFLQKPSSASELAAVVARGLRHVR